MKRNDVHDVLHVENYAALCIAICRAKPTSIEDAFTLYEDGSLHRRGGRRNEGKGRQRIQEMINLRKAGCTWPEIGEMLGLKSPHSYFCHRRELVEEVLRSND